MKSKSAKHLGKYIKEELDERNWSPRDLADILGCEEKTVTMIIDGEQSITFDMAKKFAKVFDVSVEFFTNLQTAYDLAGGKKIGLSKAVKRIKS